jgi:hypothetical protein
MGGVYWDYEGAIDIHHGFGPFSSFLLRINDLIKESQFSIRATALTMKAQPPTVPFYTH